jgi:hypothetical protein
MFSSVKNQANRKAHFWLCSAFLKAQQLAAEIAGDSEVHESLATEAPHEAPHLEMLPPDSSVDYDPSDLGIELHPHLLYLAAYFEKLVTGNTTIIREAMTAILDRYSALESSKANGLPLFFAFSHSKFNNNLDQPWQTPRLSHVLQSGCVRRCRCCWTKGIQLA